MHVMNMKPFLNPHYIDDQKEYVLSLKTVVAYSGPLKSKSKSDGAPRYVTYSVTGNGVYRVDGPTKRHEQLPREGIMEVMSRAVFMLYVLVVADVGRM
jgi:hypothetical protein